MEEIIQVNTIEAYNDFFGLETINPLVTVVDVGLATRCPRHFTFNYGIYALFLKQSLCGDLRYGRQTYDYAEGTVTSFAPGQVVETHMADDARPAALGLLFHPDLIKGTALAREIRNYTFFSYASNEALHLSEEERTIFTDCLDKIKIELERPIDRFSKRLIAKNIELLLDYCMRFYSRQFITRAAANNDVLTRFEELLDDYFSGTLPQQAGLPTVKYFADKICLSPNYFGDLVKKETGRTAQEYIQHHLIEQAKDRILGTDKTISQIAYELGFQYSQHFNRLFKKTVGCTPVAYRKQTA